MVHVKRNSGETQDNLVWRFAREVARAGITREVGKHRYYTEPSAIRRLKRLNS